MSGKEGGIDREVSLSKKTKSGKNNSSTYDNNSLLNAADREAASVAASAAAAGPVFSSSSSSSAAAAAALPSKKRVLDLGDADIETITKFGEQLLQIQQGALDIDPDISGPMDVVRERIDQIITTTKNKSAAAAAAAAAEAAEAAAAAAAAQQQVLDEQRELCNRVLNSLTTDNFTPAQQLALLGRAAELMAQLNSQASSAIAVSEETSQLSGMIEELPRIMYNVLLSHLSSVLVTIKNITPEIATTIVSFLAGVGLVFQYLPSNIQSLFTRIPYFGAFFNILQVHPASGALLSNAAPAVSAMFYYLRNAGLDIGSARGILHNMAEEVRPLLSSGASAATSAAKSVATKLQSTATDVASNMINQLSLFLMSHDYLNEPTFFEDSQVESSQSTISSRSSNASIASNASSILIAGEPSVAKSGPIVEALAGNQGEGDSVLESVNVLDVVSTGSQSPGSQTIGSPLTDYSLDGGRKKVFYLRSKKTYKYNKSKKHKKKGRKGRITKKGRKQRRTLKRRRI